MNDRLKPALFALIIFGFTSLTTAAHAEQDRRYPCDGAWIAAQAMRVSRPAIDPGWRSIVPRFLPTLTFVWWNIDTHDGNSEEQQTGAEPIGPNRHINTATETLRPYQWEVMLMWSFAPAARDDDPHRGAPHPGAVHNRVNQLRELCHRLERIDAAETNAEVHVVLKRQRLIELLHLASGPDPEARSASW